MYNKTELDNGVRIVTERMEHVKSASVGIWVNVGSRDEAEQEGGISHLIEHMIFKGTNRRTALEIAKEIDGVGGMSNAFTSKEFTCFHAKVMSDHLPLVTDLLTDIFLESRFDPEDLERERQVILQEIKMVDDTPDELVHVMFAQHLWPGHPVGRPVMGTLGTVGAISRDDIRDYLKRAYLPTRIVISAAGDVDHQAICDLMGPAFSALPQVGPDTSRQPPRTARGLNSVDKGLEQMHVCLGSGFPSIQDERRFAAALLNIILGGNMSSRLFQEIREKRGLAYSVFSFFSAYLDTGMLGIYAGVEPRDARETVRLVLVELDRLLAGDISPQELAASQEHLKGNIILGAESVDNRMTRLAKNELTYNRQIEFDEVLDAVRRVTLDDVVALAREHLQPENLSLTALGPLGEADLPDALPF